MSPCPYTKGTRACVSRPQRLSLYAIGEALQHVRVHPSKACVITVVTIVACCSTFGSEIGGLMDFATKTRLHAEFVAGARRVPMKAGSLLLWNSRY